MQLNKFNYFSQEANLEYMSVSQYKAFLDCESRAMAELKGEFIREETKAFLIGSYVDSYYEGTLNEFVIAHPEILNARTGELKKDYAHANYIIERTQRDKLFSGYMSGEKQIIMTGSIEDVPVKVKIDSYHADKIVDLKVMKDFESIYLPEQGRLNWIEAWKYDLQGAVYQEIVYQNTGKRLPFYIAGVTKEKEPDLAVIRIPQSYLDLELNRFKQNVIRFDAIKKGFIEPERCEKCDWCKRTKVLNQVLDLEELDYE